LSDSQRDQQSSNSLASQTSYDEENFFKNAPASPNFHICVRHSQQDSNYSALNSSNSSWNEEIFQNALHDVLSTSSHCSEGSNAKTSPQKASPVALSSSLIKTTDSGFQQLERTKSSNGGNLSFSSLNKSEIFPAGINYEQSALERNFGGAPRKQHPAARGQPLFAYLTNNSQESIE
jgi:hypothetical protein